MQVYGRYEARMILYDTLWTLPFAQVAGQMGVVYSRC
jgi:hypothetical protein